MSSNKGKKTTSVSFYQLFNPGVKKALDSMDPKTALKITSIGARRILALLNQCRENIEIALLLPTINDFIQANIEIVDYAKEISADFQMHMDNLTSIMTSDGEPKPGRKQEFDDEVDYVKESSKNFVNMISDMPEVFEPLFEENDRQSAVKPQIIREISKVYDFVKENLSKHSSFDIKRERVIKEIENMKEINENHISVLKKNDAKLSREKEAKIRAKEEELDQIKKQLIQAKSSDTQQQEEQPVDELIVPDDVTKLGGGALLVNEQGQEIISGPESENKEKLKSIENELHEKKSDYDKNVFKKVSSLRKIEEELNEIIADYDKKMSFLTNESNEAQKELIDLERKLSIVKDENEKIKTIRSPYMKDEEFYVKVEKNNTQLYQDMNSSAIVLQVYIRRFLKTAPRPKKKK